MAARDAVERWDDVNGPKGYTIEIGWTLPQRGTVDPDVVCVLSSFRIPAQQREPASLSPNLHHCSLDDGMIEMLHYYGSFFRVFRHVSLTVNRLILTLS
jgi:hypothetical protein